MFNRLVRERNNNSSFANSTRNIQRQPQCSTLPLPQQSSLASSSSSSNSNGRNKVQLLPNHGPLNWVQFMDKKSTKLKVTLMKIISILISVFSDDTSKNNFIKDNQLKFPDQVEFLLYLSKEVFNIDELIVQINEIEVKKISLFEHNKDDKLFNKIFAKIMAKIEMNTVFDLFSNNKNPLNFKIDKEAVLRNYQMKNINIYWMVLNGRIYYITPYFMYHPGGDSILIKLLQSSKNTVDRIDKYKEFKKYHRWVNETDLLAPHLIGYV